MSIASFAPQRTASASNATIEQQLVKLGVVVHNVTYGPNHKFGICEWCNEIDSVASCNVYPRDGWFNECCLTCVVFVTEQAITDSQGYSEYCTVEIGTVETPAPIAVVVPAPRHHDLAVHSPVACDVCPDARNSVAQFEISFDVIHHGEPEGIRWLVCSDCLQSCLTAASVQNRGFTPPILTVLPTREVVAA
jgi:hypothetical protein